jgi:hypothetical protein
MTAVEGTINGVAFQAVLEPDGQKGHWLKVDRKMREAAGADVGDMVTAGDRAGVEEPEPKVPADLRKALAAAPAARALWSDITPMGAPRLDPLDHLCEAAGNSGAPGRECLLDAGCGEATRLLLRSVGIL